MQTHNVCGHVCANQGQFMHMNTLHRVFVHPYYLLKNSNIPVSRREYLLKRWRDERTQFLLENCRDMDYLQDEEMERLLQAVQDLRLFPERYQ